MVLQLYCWSCDSRKWRNIQTHSRKPASWICTTWLQLDSIRAPWCWEMSHSHGSPPIFLPLHDATKYLEFIEWHTRPCNNFFPENLYIPNPAILLRSIIKVILNNGSDQVMQKSYWRRTLAMWAMGYLYGSLNLRDDVLNDCQDIDVVRYYNQQVEKAGRGEDRTVVKNGIKRPFITNDMIRDFQWNWHEVLYKSSQVIIEPCIRHPKPRLRSWESNLRFCANGARINTLRHTAVIAELTTQRSRLECRCGQRYQWHRNPPCLLRYTSYYS